MVKKLFLSISLFLITQLCFSQYELSEEFYNVIQDTLKPTDRKDIKLMELLRVLDHNSLAHSEYKKEKDSLIEIVKQNAYKLKGKDRIDASFMLMLYNFNHNHKDSLQTFRYGDTLKSLIGNNKEGHYYQLFMRGSLNATYLIENNQYGKAIDKLNEIISYSDKVEDLAYLPNAYITMGYANFQTFQFDKALKNCVKADSIASIYSTIQFKSYINRVKKDIKVEIPTLQFIDSNNDAYLELAQQNLDTIISHQVPGSDPSHINSNSTFHQSFIHYLKGDFENAKKEFEEINLESVLTNTYFSSSYRIKTLNALLQIKDNKQEEAFNFYDTVEVKAPTDYLYKELLGETLYKYYLDKGDTERSNNLYSQIRETNISQSIYRYQGLIAEANKKYNVGEKEMKIMELENEIQQKKNRDLLLYSTSTLLLILLLGIGILKSKQNKIKALISEETYNKKVRLLEESLQEVDRKVTDNRKEIGQKIHNEYLSSLLALKYLVTDYTQKATSKKAADKLNIIIDELDALYQESRNYSHQLIHDNEDQKSLNIIEYTENLQARFTEVGLLDIETNIPENISDILNKKEQQAIYHLIKESITNTIKHADAKKVMIEISIKDKVCTVLITDNGQKKSKINHNIKMKTKSGVGLESLQQLIKKLNGNIDFINESNGFKTIASFPLSPKSI
ncbi:hypothetical protein JM658_00465 [Joostella atrarenae]|uniref:histidine kinase n=1 Tax=Joostella atrarenae TaxID=679257 RepID=A0ABS9IYN2_9FLAO|nr:ATP-binding protein [Joostella atrarenae]MCF8713289.1 hypothetical protein [Joostella atrarenae]